MEVLQTIKERRSYRSYLDQPVRELSDNRAWLFGGNGLQGTEPPR